MLTLLALQTCGRTKDAGVVDVAKELAAIESGPGVPSVGANGLVSATIHQVNQDGAGPYKFEVSPSGNMNDWVVRRSLPRSFFLLSELLLTISRS